ncbi:MAG: cation:proton antiporter [Lachnospiraceae bacterium]|nr:cation:proton antiporter [Lachnospiraceae bacterium]
MVSYDLFLDLALIIATAKIFGILARKLKAPQVVGMIVAGLVLGPSFLNYVQLDDSLTVMAEIGVVLLMFSAGLETDLKKLMHTGVKSFFIACAGVFLPLALGTVYYLFYYGWEPIGSPQFLEACFIGTIMTATSVSITVQTLKELGKIETTLGTTIVSAAIIDDVIGIIVLTVVSGFKSGDAAIGKTLLSIGLFFALCIIIGYVIYRGFVLAGTRWPHTRRIPIMGMVLCFFMAYVAEEYFGIADITGAYFAGIILCNTTSSEYIDEKMNINSYMVFGPLFFASIGLKTDIGKVGTGILLFSVGFILVALLSKIIGCGLVGLIAGFKGKDSLKIGVGMMTRGEVALIVAQKGLSIGLVDSSYFTSVILLIIVSSIATPILLKALYSGDDKKDNKPADAAQEA